MLRAVDSWTDLTALVLVVVAVMRVRELDVRAAYVLYAAGGLALVGPCFCSFPTDLVRSSTSYDTHETILAVGQIVGLTLHIVIAALTLTGIAMAARALPARKAA